MGRGKPRQHCASFHHLRRSCCGHGKASFSCHCTYSRGYLSIYHMLPCKKGKAARQGGHQAGSSAQLLVSVVFCEKRGKAFSGADSNCRTRDENPQPSSTHLHTHPETSAAGSLQLLLRLSESESNNLLLECPQRRLAGAGVAATAVRATEVVLLSHTGLCKSTGAVRPRF